MRDLDDAVATVWLFCILLMFVVIAGSLLTMLVRWVLT